MDNATQLMWFLLFHCGLWGHSTWFIQVSCTSSTMFLMTMQVEFLKRVFSKLRLLMILGCNLLCALCQRRQGSEQLYEYQNVEARKFWAIESAWRHSRVCFSYKNKPFYCLTFHFSSMCSHLCGLFWLNVLIYLFFIINYVLLISSHCDISCGLFSSVKPVALKAKLIT